MRDYSDLIGQRFVALRVIKILPRERGENGRLKRAMAVCLCDCGREKIAGCGDLQDGRYSSCGCRTGNTDGRGGLRNVEPCKHHSCPSPELTCTFATVLGICCHECPRKDKCNGGTCKNSPDKCGAIYIHATPEVRDFLKKKGDKKCSKNL